MAVLDPHINTLRISLARDVKVSERVFTNRLFVLDVEAELLILAVICVFAPLR